MLLLPTRRAAIVAGVIAVALLLYPGGDVPVLATIAGLAALLVLIVLADALVGTSPMQYLTQWRMLLAANLLRNSNAPLANIAEEVGYVTDTAFSRAFRREYGAPPAKWRRTQAGAERLP